MFDWSGGVAAVIWAGRHASDARNNGRERRYKDSELELAIMLRSRKRKCSLKTFLGYHSSIGVLVAQVRG